MALVPVLFALVAAACDSPMAPILRKRVQERAAIYVAGAAVGVAIAFWLRRRDPVLLLLGVIATAMLCREIHWDWTKPMINIAVPVLGVWAFLWRDRLGRSPGVVGWLVATAAAYFVSQLIARRVFAGVLPNEDLIQNRLEETMETVAHTMLLVTILVAVVSRSRWAGTVDGTPG